MRVCLNRGIFPLGTASWRNRLFLLEWKKKNIFIKTPFLSLFITRMLSKCGCVYVCVYGCMRVCVWVCLYAWVYIYVCVCVCRLRMLYVDKRKPKHRFCPGFSFGFLRYSVLSLSCFCGYVHVCVHMCVCVCVCACGARTQGATDPHTCSLCAHACTSSLSFLCYLFFLCLMCGV